MSKPSAYTSDAPRARMAKPETLPAADASRTVGHLVRGIGGIFGIWIAGFLAMRLSGAWVPPGVFLYRWVAVFFVLLNICLAALATAVFLTYAAEVLRARHRLRFGIIVGCVCLSGFCFAATRLFTPQLPAIAYALNTANLIAFACLLGSWIVWPIKRPAELVPVCLVMTLADFFSVLNGPSRKIAETIRAYQESSMAGPPPWAEFILFKIAIPGSDRLVPVFGLADWVVLAFFSAAAARFGINDNLAGRSIGEMVRKGRPGFYLPVAAFGLFAAVLMARALGLFLPALPVMVAFFLVYVMSRYPEARRLSRHDWVMTGGAAAVMLGLMAAYRYAP